jgi:hypothetical protein
VCAFHHQVSLARIREGQDDPDPRPQRTAIDQVADRRQSVA